MKKILVEFYDYRNGATSPIDNIIVPDDYTPKHYIDDCENNCVDVTDYRYNGKIIFTEIDD